MKIALIIPSLVKGGAERTVSNLSLALEKQHDVSVVVLDSDNQCYPHGGRLIDLQTPPSAGSAAGRVMTLLKRAWRLKKLFREERFDGVFAFMEAAGAPAVMASRQTIVSVRDAPESLPGFSRLLIRLFYWRANKVVAVAKATEKKLQQQFGLKKTTTIYNMAAVEMAEKLSQEPIDKEQPFILAVGRLAPQKGFDLLIEAYAQSRCKDEIPLLILGEGPEQASLEQLIKDRELSGRVTLYGNSDNPFAFYGKADFFVLSSRHEGFPNILVEALACHCACVAVDCPTGPNEIIVDGENGRLIEPENIPLLAKTLDEVYFVDALKQRFRDRARASVAHLSPEAIAQSWVDLIEN